MVMRRPQPNQKKLIAENEDLRRRLREAEETLEAIRRGEVDALVVSGPQGEQIYTLKGAERHYRILLERMNEGAVTITRDGTVTYCNDRFTDMVKSTLSEIINSSIYDFFSPADKAVLKQTFRKKGGNYCMN